MTAKTRKRRSASTTREVLYGFHPVLEALIAGRRTIYSVMVDRKALSDRQQQVVEHAEKKRIAWQVNTPDQIRAAAGSDQHQGIAASVSPLPTESIKSVFSDTGPTADHCMLVLVDGIVDPHNLGAIVRTAHCAGADALVVPKDRAVGATPVVSKTSAGALEHTRLCRVPVTDVTASGKRLTIQSR